MILEKLSNMDVTHPGIKFNAFYNKYIIIVWYYFNINHTAIVTRKVSENQPWLHTPNNSHHLRNSTQWKTLSSRKFDNPLEISHGNILVQVSFNKNAYVWIIRGMFGAKYYFLDIPRATDQAMTSVRQYLP